VKKIAIEEHFFTESLVDHLRSRKEWPRWETIEGEKLERVYWSPSHYMPSSPELKSLLLDLGERRLKVMDEAGIDMQVLSLSAPGVESLPASDGTSLAKRINDEVANVIKKYPKRFASFAAIAPQDPGAAANELERAVKELGFKGAVINSHIRGEYLDNQKYWVIFDKAEKLGVPIYLHPKQPPPDMLKPYLTYPVLASATWGFAADGGLHAMRLICSGLFDKYPGLKIILGHLGEAIPFWLQRMDNRWQWEGQGGLLSGQFAKKRPSHYFQNNFVVTTSGMFWEPVMQYVCSVLGVDSILFAVDYPYESSKEAVQFMESLQIGDNDKEKIYHLNAEKLLNL
jgi:5-carboxyvanillate decarboxylase